MENRPSAGVYRIGPRHGGESHGWRQSGNAETTPGRAYGRPVLYARQWCDTPEDIVQDVLLRLMQAPAAPANPVGWLYQVVRNKALNAARSSRRRARHEATAARHGEPWLAVSEGNRLDAEAAAGALAELPIEQREVIVARLWGGLSFEETAHLPARRSAPPTAATSRALPPCEKNWRGYVRTRKPMRRLTPFETALAGLRRGWRASTASG